MNSFSFRLAEAKRRRVPAVGEARPNQREAHPGHKVGQSVIYIARTGAKGSVFLTALIRMSYS